MPCACYMLPIPGWEWAGSASVAAHGAIESVTACLPGLSTPATDLSSEPPEAAWREHAASTRARGLAPARLNAAAATLHRAARMHHSGSS
jgi:hypothetical protein